MKKLFATITCAFIVLSAYAQFEIDSLGRIFISADTIITKNKISIGTRDTSSTNYKYTNIYSKISKIGNGDHAAVVGDASCDAPSLSYRGVGVLGIANGTSMLPNYGVCGEITSGVGYAVYGTVPAQNQVSATVTECPVGTFAGYFAGDVYVSGSLRARSITTSSDIRLKENISSITDDDNTLSKILNMNVVKYNFKFTKDKIDSKEISDTYRQYLEKERNRGHYGLIAQELQELYPDLVVENQDGLLSVNYIEIIPLLIKSIQELKREVEELRGTGESNVKGAGTTGMENLTKNTNTLYQNTPNPYKESTTIRFNLSDEVKMASICIFDMQGKMLKKVPVTPEDYQVTISAFELGEGIFLYTLIADGIEIDTKRMILTK